MDEHDWKAEADSLIADRPPYEPCKMGRTFHPSEILNAVCTRRGVCRDDVVSRCKTLPIVEARTEYCGVSRELTCASFFKIAREIGTQHSTAHHAWIRWNLRDHETRRHVVNIVREIALGRHGRTQ